MRKDIIVVGAGASGMMAAVTAAENRKSVMLLEQLSQPGKKIYATGNGKCNYTNRYQQMSCYRGEDMAFIEKALSHFSYDDTIRKFCRMGVLPGERNGYIYPVSGQASSVVDAFLRQLEMLRIDVHTEERVAAVIPDDKNDRKHKSVGYLVRTDRGEYRADKVILAVGGQAAPVHGSRGDGYRIAQGLGIKLLKPLPALTSCVLKGDFTKEWARIRVKGKISLYRHNGELLAEDEGELQMVSYGLSGIPVFQVSRYAARALEEGDKPYFLMDIMPGYSLEELEKEIARRSRYFQAYTGEQALEGMVHFVLGRVLLKSLGIKPGEKAGLWSGRDIHRIAERFKKWKVGISEMKGFDFAQVTTGGVLTSQIDPETMELKEYPGLYMTGELLDVDGICGGYNLQWAWTSGYLAGMAAAQSLRAEKIGR